MISCRTKLLDYIRTSALYQSRLNALLCRRLLYYVDSFSLSDTINSLPVTLAPSGIKIKFTKWPRFRGKFWNNVSFFCSCCCFLSLLSPTFGNTRWVFTVSMATRCPIITNQMDSLVNWTALHRGTLRFGSLSTSQKQNNVKSSLREFIGWNLSFAIIAAE